jgi:hypothetical protein
MRSSVCVSERISRKCYILWYDVFSGSTCWEPIGHSFHKASLAPHHSNLLCLTSRNPPAYRSDTVLLFAACTYLQVRLGLCI